MRRTRVSVAVTATLLALSIALAGVAGADGRIPVNSTDDPGRPIASRIAAVTNVVQATNARVDRVANAWPPNPCDPTLPEPDPLCLDALGVLGAYAALGSSVDAVCSARAIDGAPRTTISDEDVYAADMTASGLAGQLGSIVLVLGNADARLGVIVPDPGPPEVPVTASLHALYEAVAAGGTEAGGLVAADGIIWPPNPCAAP